MTKAAKTTSLTTIIPASLKNKLKAQAYKKGLTLKAHVIAKLSKGN